MIKNLRILLWHLSEFFNRIPCWHYKGFQRAVMFRTNLNNHKPVAICTLCLKTWIDAEVATIPR